MPNPRRLPPSTVCSCGLCIARDKAYSFLGARRDSGGKEAVKRGLRTNGVSEEGVEMGETGKRVDHDSFLSCHKTEELENTAFPPATVFAIVSCTLHLCKDCCPTNLPRAPCILSFLFSFSLFVVPPSSSTDCFAPRLHLTTLHPQRMFQSERCSWDIQCGETVVKVVVSLFCCQWRFSVLLYQKAPISASDSVEATAYPLPPS